jgi:predicted O-methyltransferase YrrM
MTSNEAMALADCVKLLPDNPVIVQIGAYIGVSTIVMLETRLDAFVFSIDVRPWKQERVNILEAGLDARRVVRVLGDASQINWPFVIDLLYIDGNHYYEAVRADCEAWVRRGLIK